MTIKDPLVVLLDEVKDAFKNTCYSDCFAIVENTVYFRYDTEDSNPKEQWDNFIMCRDDLVEKGYTLRDAQTEHDCITGDVVYNGTE